jgi:hypothetical protein
MCFVPTLWPLEEKQKVVKLSTASQELSQSSLFKHKMANVSGLMLPIVIKLQLKSHSSAIFSVAV